MKPSSTNAGKWSDVRMEQHQLKLFDIVQGVVIPESAKGLINLSGAVPFGRWLDLVFSRYAKVISATTFRLNHSQLP